MSKIDKFGLEPPRTRLEERIATFGSRSHDQPVLATRACAVEVRVRGTPLRVSETATFAIALRAMDVRDQDAAELLRAILEELTSAPG